MVLFHYSWQLPQFNMYTELFHDDLQSSLIFFNVKMNKSINILLIFIIFIIIVINIIKFNTFFVKWKIIVKNNQYYITILYLMKRKKEETNKIIK